MDPRNNKMLSYYFRQQCSKIDLERNVNLQLTLCHVAIRVSSILLSALCTAFGAPALIVQ
jgi:hypothetical protein